MPVPLEDTSAMTRYGLTCALALCLALPVSAQDPNEPVYFKDANLKAAVEQALGKTDPNATDMLALTSLDAMGRGITDLTGLEYATELTVLNLSDNRISDISALEGLVNLSSLHLDANQVTDVSALAGLVHLTFLNLTLNSIHDVSTLVGLAELETVLLGRNPISDVGFLAGKMKLTRLGLGYNAITDISVLSQLTNLEVVELYELQISDFSALSGLTKLKHLVIYHNVVSLSDISALAGLAGLEWLDLGGNQISDVSALAGMANLKWLDLHWNRISDISALAGMTILTRLNLKANPLNAQAYLVYIPQILTNNPGINLSYDPPVWKTLTISSTDGGTVTVPGEGPFQYVNGEVVALEAQPDDVVHQFVNWTGSAVAAGKVADPNATKTTVQADADSTLQANFRFVSSLVVNGSADPNGDGSVAHPYRTIQEAINAFDPNVHQAIGVMDGVYTGPGNRDLDFKGKAVWLHSAHGPGSCVIDCQGSSTEPHRAFYFHTGEVSTSVVEGFTIRGGYADQGSAILCEAGSPTVTNCRLEQNGPQALWLSGGQVTLKGAVEVQSGSLGGTGTVFPDKGSELTVQDGVIACNLTGPGSLTVPPGTALTISSTAVVKLGSTPVSVWVKGTLHCEGRIRVEGQASLIESEVLISAGGKLTANGSATIQGNSIEAVEDDFLTVPGSGFSGTIQGNQLRLTLSGGGDRILEVRGLDPHCTGQCASGLVHLVSPWPSSDLSTWALGRLEVGPGTKVSLVNRFVDQPGAGQEVLYVRQLVLGPGAVLNLGSQRVYYTTLTQDQTARVINDPVPAFSLGVIDFSDPNVFANSVSTSGPGAAEIVRGRMRLETADGNEVQAKARFARCREDRVSIRFKYLFGRSDLELAVYLSDSPVVGDHDPAHAIGVTTLTPPPPGQPGSPGNAVFGQFEQAVSTAGLDLSQGAWVELELAQGAGTPDPNSLVHIDDWAVQAQLNGP